MKWVKTQVLLITLMKGLHLNRKEPSLMALVTTSCQNGYCEKVLEKDLANTSLSLASHPDQTEIQTLS